MNRPARPIVAAALLALLPAPAAAADPFEQVNGIVRWFVALNASWKGVVADQERAQLLRSVDRLRRSLYQLEADSSLLLYSIGDERPDAVETARLAEAVTSLRTSLAGVTAASRALGADLRLYGGGDAETLTWHAGVTRGLAIDTLDSQLDDPAKWNAALVRDRLQAGVAALDRAQLAVTKFRQTLAQRR